MSNEHSREMQRRYWTDIETRRITVTVKPNNRRPYEDILREYEGLRQEPRYAGEFLISPSLAASLKQRR